jgi:anti-sigma factor RsiW
MEPMSDDRQFETLREIGWRRRLSREEQANLDALLARNPAFRGQWLQETALTRALKGMPDVPVSSNFNAQVLAQIQRQAGVEARRSRSTFWSGLRGNWLPRLAFATVLVTTGITSYRVTQGHQRVHLVEGVAAVSQVASLPDAEILKDFDAIRVMDKTSGPDEELLRLLE